MPYVFRRKTLSTSSDFSLAMGMVPTVDALLRYYGPWFDSKRCPLAMGDAGWRNRMDNRMAWVLSSVH